MENSRHPVRLSEVTCLIDENGQVSPGRVCEHFGLSKIQLARMLGLSNESIYKASRTKSPSSQLRLKEMIEVIARVNEWAGGSQHAMAWYRSQPMAAFGGRTAESLVKTGQACELRDYLDHLALGNFA